MSRIAITTDSPADMPAALLERYDVKSVPLHITLGTDCFEDGINITPSDIYTFYDEHKQLPKTSAVSVAEYMDFFAERLAYHDALVHISMGSKISSTHQNARIAAAEFDNVYVVDSESLFNGIALLVIKAAELRDKDVPAEEIAKQISGMVEKVNTTFIVDKLEFLKKGGRCSSLAALGANVLGIKPSIAMKDGVLSIGKKYRGKSAVCRQQYVRDQVEAHKEELDTDRVFVARTEGVPDEEFYALAEEVRTLGGFDEVLTTYAGCTITSHCGKGTFCIMFMTK